MEKSKDGKDNKKEMRLSSGAMATFTVYQSMKSSFDKYTSLVHPSRHFMVIKSYLMPDSVENDLATMNAEVAEQLIPLNKAEQKKLRWYKGVNGTVMVLPMN